MFVPAVSCLVSYFRSFDIHPRSAKVSVHRDPCVCGFTGLSCKLSFPCRIFLSPSIGSSSCVCVCVHVECRLEDASAPGGLLSRRADHRSFPFFHLVGGNESSMAPACSSGMDQYCSPHRIVQPAPQIRSDVLPHLPH